MQSYMNSPQYQMMMAQLLRNSQPRSQYPAEAVLNGVAEGLDAYQMKRMTDKGEARDAAKTKAYAEALMPPPGDVQITQPITAPGQVQERQAAGAYDGPSNSTQTMARLLSGGNTDALAEFAPQYAKQLMEGDTPVTPYQRAELARQNRLDSPEYQGQIKALPGPQAQPKPQSVVDQEMALKAAPGPAPQPTAGMSPEAFDQQKKLAQIKADISAQTQGEFGRSLQGKSYNILAAGLKDPSVRSTPEYATAWQILSNPRVDPNTGTIVTPDLSAFAPPTGGQPQQPVAPAGAPGAPPPQRMPSVQSFAPPNPSQPEAASAGYANRLSESSKLIDQNQGAGASLFNRTVSGLPGGNYAVGSDYQQLDQAERNFVNAQLRRESGAAISESEFQNARKQYFPQPGDKPEVLAQKKKARDMAVQNMQLSAGNTLLPPGVVQQSSPPKGAPMVPQQQGFGATPAASGGWKIERVQ